MIVVDASRLFEVVTDTERAEAIRQRMTGDRDQAAPHVVDFDVVSLIRGERLLERIWELRDSVRGWDAPYVALAEVLDATLITLDARLARANGPRCPIEVVTA